MVKSKDLGEIKQEQNEGHIILPDWCPWQNIFFPRFALKYALNNKCSQEPE